AAFNLPAKEGGQVALAWSKKIAQTPVELLAADGKLFVLTQEGGLLCFGDGSAELKNYPLKDGKLAAEGSASELAAKVLEISQAREGYALMLGLDRGKLVRHLLQHTPLLVLAVDPDKKLIDQLRRELATEGIYDHRFQAMVADPASV